MGNFFHDQWKKAESGLSEYIAIFVPWFWQAEYVKDASAFSPNEEEEKLKAQYWLADDQLAWRRNKIIELSAGGVNGEVQFKQEYPMNAAEAFQMTGIETLISPDSVMAARKRKVAPAGPVILGVDPSHGGDRFAMIVRRGTKMYDPRTYVKDQVDTLEKRAAKVISMLEEHSPDMTFVDSGFGADLVDYLRSLGYMNIKAIAFGGTPQKEDRYVNKRAEMYGRMSDWLNDENMHVQVPDSDELQADLCACPYFVDANNRIQIKRKDQIRKDLGFSPDLGDAAALTFAEPVRDRKNMQARPAVAKVSAKVYR
jgi:hypothetical protein